MSEPVPGRYRHYKGKDYTVVGVARHSETLEEAVVYRQEYGARGLWIRPKEMFLEMVHTVDGDVPRFQHIPDEARSSPPKTGSLFAGLPAHLPDELLETLLTAANVRIERIVSRGHASPADFWYDQEEDEWVALLEGAARLCIGGAVVEMKPGDYLNIPAHTRHRVEWTAPGRPTLWLAVFYEAGSRVN